ncbi:MAG: NAD-dependent epimerase/dehydratase family protein [Actinobacteria bacterium]|nr:NAD-dependent epimerase/dehydratase family protein [Actinomycetota bacterium]
MARTLAGSHVVVVGATGVLGSSIAVQLAAAGAKVSAIVRDHTQLDGASVSQYALADVTDHAALSTAFASALHSATSQNWMTRRLPRSSQSTPLRRW